MNVICETGGRTCLENHVESLKFTLSTVNGVEFRVYSNGKVTDVNGKLICETGGQTCIIEHLGLVLN
jgi:hypothetical protein